MNSPASSTTTHNPLDGATGTSSGAPETIGTLIGKYDKTKYILYFYILFANDCSLQDDFEFGADLLEEYIKQNLQAHAEEEYGTRHVEYVEMKPKGSG